MRSYTEQVIRTTVLTNSDGLPFEWEMELDLPDDPWSYGFRALGRDGTFPPRSIRVIRHPARPGGPRPATIAIEVRSEIGKPTSASIILELPWVYATELARLIVKAARSLDHAALDAIAELLDGREWSGTDNLDAIATLVRHTGREVRDVHQTPADEDDQEQVLCRFCQRQCLARTAHSYQGGWVGDECCWDERLRSSQ
jgi:hypothetical protein